MAGGSVGQVYYDVLPNLDGFAAKVASGLSRSKPIKIPVEVDSAKAAASLKQTTQQTTALSTSSARLAAAQGKVRVTAAQLNDVRAKGATGSAKLVAAEERYASALRGVGKARDLDAKEAARASAAVARANDRAAASQAKQAAAAAKATAAQKAIRTDTLNSASRGLAIGGAATLAALAGITKVTADFDSAVSNVAATGKEAKASLSTLRAEAIKYGADTSFSATEAANAQAELIKANVSVTDTINGGLAGALDLAAAGSLGVADAAGIMGTTLSQFKLPGTDASHVADLLAAAAGKAQGEVTDFSEALKYVGPLAASAGVGIEETTGVLAEFANQGILGSQAGTSLRSIFLGLQAPVGAGAKAIEKYGINVRDAKGNFIGLEGAAGELQKRLGGLTRAQRDAALSAIFGKNALTAATIFYEEGAEGVRSMTDAVNDNGYAAETARTKLDNLKGDVEQLGGAFESAFIQTGTSSQGGARIAVQAVTGIVDAYSKLPEVGKNTAFIGAGLAASAAIGAAGVLKIITVAKEAKVALAALSITARTAGLAAGGIGAGIAIAATVIGNFAIKSAEAKARTDDLTQAFLSSKGAIDDNIASMRAKTLEDSGALKAAQDLGISIDDVTQASLGNAGAQDRVNAKLNAYAQVAGGLSTDLDRTAYAQDGVAKAARQVQDAIAGGNKELSTSTEAYKRQMAAAAAAGGSADKVVGSFIAGEIAFRNGAGALDEAGGAAGRTADEIAALTQEMYDNANAALALSGNNIAVEAAMDSAAAAAKRNGKNLDDNTAKGRDNLTELDRLVSVTNTATQAMDTQGKSVESIAARNERAKNSWIDTAVAMGRNRDKAEELADELFVLPERVTTQVVLSGGKISRKEAKDLNQQLKGIPEKKRAEIVAVAKTKGVKEASRQIAAVKNKSVIARATGKGVNTVKEIDGAIKKLKSKGVQAQARAAGKPAVDALDRAVRKLKTRKVDVVANTSGKGAVDSLSKSIASVNSKTVTVRLRTVRTAGKSTLGGDVTADGGTLRLPGHKIGGTIEGTGGPRQDNIAMIDRRTGLQTSWGSVGEEVINQQQATLNRRQLKQINAGGKWDLIPRHADGGTIGGKASSTIGGKASRPLILNINMGDLGIRRIVTEIVEDRDEYTASIGRM